MNILGQAAETIEQRGEFYGDPQVNHAATAELWTTYLRRRGLILDWARLDGRDVCWLNVLQKASRDADTRQPDNLIDGAGYLANAGKFD